MGYEADLRQTALKLKIIVFNLGFGVVGLAVIGAFIGPMLQGHEQVGELLRWIALGLPLFELPAAFMLYSLQGGRIAEAEDWQTRLGIYRARTIVTVALIEAPALFAGVVILLTGLSWHAVPAIVIFLVSIAVLFPTPARITKAIGKEDGTIPDKYS